ncbi:ACP S-malonyltransferase [Marinicella sp. W31]|uniref:ACP S-malonyltransferase n=1 Tax=Marinicella sp. W31 TaxID=3023713 RepID=UPI003756335D
MPKTALIFPGQGSQSVGMLADLPDAFETIKNHFEQASAILDKDLWTLVTDGPEEELNQTQWTQPALLTASVATFDVIKSRLPSDTIMAGHSLGEYSALVCAGILAFEDAVSLVHKRGQYMQAAVPAGSGAMAAVIGMEAVALDALCQQVDEVVSPANYNSSAQIVIAGSKAGVEAASALAAEAGAKVIPLAVSVPSHCALMKPAAEQLAQDLQAVTFNSSETPVVHNVDVESHKIADDIRQALVAQLSSPVRWADTMQYFKNQGITEVGECGPGKVLSGLYKRFDRSTTVVPLANQKGIGKFIDD